MSSRVVLKKQVLKEDSGKEEGIEKNNEKFQKGNFPLEKKEEEKNLDHGLTGDLNIKAFGKIYQATIR